MLGSKSGGDWEVRLGYMHGTTPCLHGEIFICKLKKKKNGSEMLQFQSNPNNTGCDLTHGLEQNHTSPGVVSEYEREGSLICVHVCSPASKEWKHKCHFKIWTYTIWKEVPMREGE